MKKKVLSAAKKKVAKKVAKKVVKKEKVWPEKFSNRLVELEKIANGNGNLFAFVMTKNKDAVSGSMISENLNIVDVVRLFLDQVEDSAPGAARIGMMLHLHRKDLPEKKKKK